MTRKSTELKSLFKDDFLIGAAVTPKTIDSQKELIVQHFNSITAENEMKFERVHPLENQYSFEEADKLIEFANNHKLQMRGHTLVWHNQTPPWMFEQSDGSELEREALLSRMKAHIDTVLNRYYGKIYAWDVVNEAISDSDGQFLRDSKWRDIIGDDFIEKAFTYARAADPNALLFYNDYNEFVPEKRDKIYQLIKSMIDKGVPIDGIGLQGHWNLEYPSIDLMKQGIEKYASLGLQLHITELDVSMFLHEDKRTDLKAPTKEMLELQAIRYKEIFSLLKEYRKHITSVTFWGVADDYTWLDNFPVRGRKNWPFLFDQFHKPKQSYHELLKLN
ncbi:endo-1,4-beta-xylanase [Bacillus sp. TS-2]|nr:endo-1,4-beta-xylanase [Bacillus sp. TS-2]